MSETLRGEVSGRGVRVSVLCPTFFKTNLMSTSRGPDRHRNAANKLMAEAQTGASDVARAGLRALEADQLYAVPMLDGRVLWRFKRALPGSYAGLLAWLTRKGLIPS